MTDDLLAVARTLASLEDRRPRQVSLRRAISTAYYAVFHKLAKTCADELIGVTKVNSAAWVRVYRAVNHGDAKNAFKSKAVLGLDTGVKDFGVAFITLQEQRLAADYDPSASFTRNEGLAAVDQATIAASRLMTTSSDNLRALATYVLLKSR